MSTEDYNRALARNLVTSEKSVRDSSVQELQKYLNSLDSCEELVMMKLWKALFYCTFLSDKVPIQMELCANLSNLIHCFKKHHLVHLFLRSFFRTIMREWTMLDQFRINKFYTLVRYILRESFKFHQSLGWDEAITSEFISILSIEVFQRTPNGIRLHLTDIYLDELHSATDGNVSVKLFRALLEPLLAAMVNERDDAFLTRIGKQIFSRFIEIFADTQLNEENDVGALEGQSEVKRFSKIHPCIIQFWLFELASEENIREDNRLRIYDLHKQYQKATGERHVSEDRMQSLVSLSIANETPNRGKEKKKEKKEKKEEKRQELEKEKEKAKEKDKVKEKEKEKESKHEKSVQSPKHVEVVEEKKERKEKKEKKMENKLVQNSEMKEVKEVKEAVVEPPKDFIVSKKFAGSRPGMVFKKGPKGLGYYLDAIESRKEARRSKKDQGKKHQEERKKTPDSGSNKRPSTTPSSGEDESPKRVSFGKNHSKAYLDSIASLRQSTPESVSKKKVKGVLKASSSAKAGKVKGAKKGH